MLDAGDEFGLETKEEIYKLVSKEEINAERFKNSTHASHVMYFSEMDPTHYDMKYCILMQLRFDGYIGFPGGLVDPGETPEDAASRETEEEMGVPRKDIQITCNDHVVTHYSENKNLLLHFFAKEISVEQMDSLHVAAIKQMKHEPELMGILRVPLYTKSDGFRGFPAFLTNSFAGNAKLQLLSAVVKRCIMTQEEVDKALAAKPLFFENFVNNEQSVIHKSS